MLVTDQAKTIRMPLASLRVIGRGSAGVRLFDVAAGEHVVSAARIDEEEEPENAAEAIGRGGADRARNFAPDDGATIGDDVADGPEDGE